jgi:lycopene epsilon-cyclase
VQAAFHVFGMELLVELDLLHTNQFFQTFFLLPDYYWRGFLSSSLSSGQLVVFAVWIFVLAPPSIKLELVRHLLTNSSGKYLIEKYARLE